MIFFLIFFFFYVTLSLGFAMAATVISDSNGNIIGVATKKIFTKEVVLGEAHEILLAVQSATSCGAYFLILEGDALNVVLTFPYIYFLSLVGTLKKFIGVLTLEHIIWLNGSLPIQCLEAFLQDHQLSLPSGSRIEKIFSRNLFPLSIRGKKNQLED
jgi:hypothetical protein